MAERTCRICGRVDPPGKFRGDGRCAMCGMYWRRHGVERPPLAPERPATPRARPCAHCGQPTPKPRLGRCTACYMYWHRTGRERPARLWQRR
jgi:hypothetical protein